MMLQIVKIIFLSVEISTLKIVNLLKTPLLLLRYSDKVFLKLKKL